MSISTPYSITVHTLGSPELFDQYSLQLQAIPWSILLHSGGDASETSRFHILCADPIATLSCHQQQCQLWQKEQNDRLICGDPLTVAQQLQHELFGSAQAWPGTTLPFIGGAVGFLSYDLGRTIETLPELAKADLNLADLGFGFYDWALILDKVHSVLYLLVQGDEHQWQKRLAWLDSRSQPDLIAFSLSAPWSANMTSAEYQQKIDQIHHYLQSGDCYQINLAQRFSAPYRGSEWLAYQQLLQQNSAPFSAFIRLENTAILSLSPERFMQVKQRADGFKVQTKPIKGTQPRSDDPAKDNANRDYLANSEKDRAENLMIVDLLRNDISRVCIAGTVKVPKLFDIESYPAVHHLVSTVEGCLQEGKDSWDLLKATFPGGSITGAPKIRAMEIIEELEPHRRSLYCGSIAYISANGEMDSSITIRTLIAENHHLYCWGGGGIVADSIAKNEYQETFDKLAKILPVLAPEQ